MPNTIIKVQGMTCNHCAMRVVKALKAVPGVKDATVDLPKGEASVSSDDGSVSREALAAAIIEAGYKAV